LISDKGARQVYGERVIFFNNWHSDNWVSTYKRMKLDHFFTTYTKINSK
jgi:hypothetical protein